MKKRYPLIIAGLVLLLILNAGIESAWAYFTTYDEADGTVQVDFVPTDITEVFDGVKHVTISNNEESNVSVWVRARAYIGGAYGLGTPTGTNWTNGTDGWSYYNLPLEPGEESVELIFSITGIPAAARDNIDEFVNVAVVYECIPVKYNENNEPIEAEPQDWLKAED